MKSSSKPDNEAQLLDLLKQVLPKATPDPRLAGKIYEAVEHELKTQARAAAFTKFCRRVPLPDLEAKSVADVRDQLHASFRDGDVTVKPDRKAKLLAVEVALADGQQFSGEIPVRANGAAEPEGEGELALKFVPFPVALPGDPELVWLLAKHENLTGDEAAMALAKAEEDFWASKTGQKLLRDRVERSFPEFIARVPAGMLRDAGLRRHYKEPEPIQTLRPPVG